MIESITLDTLVDCLPGAERFHNVYEPDYQFSPGRFLAFWHPLIESESGFILVARDKAGKVIGGIGGVITAFQTSDVFNCIEMFWWVDEDHRGRVGLKLLKAFEAEARVAGCDRITMAYMETSMPERVQALYSNLGYKPYEHHWIKNLKEN